MAAKCTARAFSSTGPFAPRTLCDRGAAGMSLVEVLVALVILAVGMLAVVRVFVPGLAILPGQGSRQLAAQLSSSIVEDMAADPQLRPFAVAHALPVNPLDPSLGYELVHDVAISDAYQWSDQVSTLAGKRLLVAPTLVIGERFTAPAADAAIPTVAHLCKRGPVRPKSGWVYYATPIPQVGNITDPRAQNLPLRWQPTNWDAGAIRFDTVGLGVQQFRACYTYLSGAGTLIDRIGEPVLAMDIRLAVGNCVLGGGVPIVPNSLTIFEEVGGAIGDWNPGPGSSDRSLGVIRVANPAVVAGTVLAVTYETQSHLRQGFETSLTDPRAPNQPLDGFYMPDIQVADATIPALSPKSVKLPLDFVRARPLADDGTYTHIPWPVVAVDGLLGQVLYLDSSDPQAGILSIDYHTGEVRFDDDVVGDILAKAGADPSWMPTADIQWPVRIFYRADGGWATEVHLAPEDFARLVPDVTSATGFSVWPAASPQGIKQFWYTLDPGAPGTLRFFNTGAGGMTDGSGAMVLVDYVYDADPGPGMNLENVTGEPHMIAMDTHSFTVNNAFGPTDPMQGIRAVRGTTLKVRTCWEQDFERHYADVDEPYLAIR